MSRLVLFLLFALAGLSRLGAQAPLQLEAATDREFYMANASHKVYLQLSVGAPAQPAAPGAAATGRNIAFVLDRSGSMAGERITALRAALTAALATLGEQDIVSLVFFDSEVETVVEAQPRGEIRDLDARLARIEPTGGAALYDALNQGAAQLRRHAGPATSNHLVLVTDGPPTKGPRETADFTKLAAVFADERITLSTIGLGSEFNEDLLASLARTGTGRFRYVAQPAKLGEALVAEVAPTGALVARDVTLTVDILSDTDDLESYGWVPAVIEGRKVTYHLPYVFAGQKIPVYLGAELWARRFSYRLARLRLAWTNVADGRPQELEQFVTARLEMDSDTVSRSAVPAVVRTAIAVVISEGLQSAIEQIDKGDFRRALRELRRARSAAMDLNFKVDDPQGAASIALLDAYLGEVQARGLNQLDRKVLRSGLFNQFSTPVAEPAKP